MYAIRILKRERKSLFFFPLLCELVRSASAAASCIILMVTSMGRLDGSYRSAPIDCLLRSSGERRVAVFFRTNGNHFGSNLSQNRANSERLGDKVIKKSHQIRVNEYKMRANQYNNSSFSFEL